MPQVQVTSEDEPDSPTPRNFWPSTTTVVIPHNIVKHGRQGNVGYVSVNAMSTGSIDALSVHPCREVKNGRVASSASLGATLAVPKYQDFSSRVATLETSNIAPVRRASQMLAAAGFFLDPGPETLRCFDCGLTLPTQPLPSDILAVHLVRSPRCEHAKSSSFVQLMRSSVRERLKTFSDRWRRSRPTAEQLARAGFFLPPEAGSVPQCAFCRVTISSWPEHVHPFDLHGQISWRCAFVLNPPPYAVGYDVCGRTEHVTPSSDQPSSTRHAVTEPGGQTLSLSLSNRSPEYPEMASPDTRMATFDSWTAPVDKRRLVESGLFSLGISDVTKCFHCGVGLFNWMSGDDPWEEHAKQYPDCEFVRLTKGDEFVQKMKGLHSRSSMSAQVPKLHTPGGLPPRHCVSKVNPSLLYSRVNEMQAPNASLRGPSSEVTVTRCDIQQAASEDQPTSTGAPQETPSARCESSEVHGPQTELRCVLCQSAPREVLFLPCSHFSSCASCATSLSLINCPLCNVKIQKVLRLNVS